MKIKMLQTTMGSDDGYSTFEYLGGQEYDVSTELGEAFLRSKVGVLVVVPPKVQTKEIPVKGALNKGAK